MEVIKGKTNQPPRIVLSGEHGLGKSTFASKFPNPIALDLEGGLEQVGVTRTPRIRTLLEFEAALSWVRAQDYKTLIIDSLDILETYVQQDIAARVGVKDISDIPFGAGYKQAATTLFNIMADLDTLVEHKRMIIVLISHVQIKSFKNPAGPDYDKYMLDLREDVARFVRDWCDILTYIELEKFITKEAATFGKSAAKASTAGNRIMHFAPAVAYDTKTRFALPDSLPLDFPTFWAALKEAMIGADKKEEMKESEGVVLAY